MAVVKVGDDPAIKKNVTCGHCGSILQYLPCDVDKRVTTDYTGDRDWTYSIECSECGKRIYVEPT